MPCAPQEGRKVSLEEILPEKSRRKRNLTFFVSQFEEAGEIHPKLLSTQLGNKLMFSSMTSVVEYQF